MTLAAMLSAVHRGMDASTDDSLAAADLPGIWSTLTHLAAGTPSAHDDLSTPSRGQVLDLQTRLRDRERELASASARVAELEAALRTGGEDQQHPGAAPANRLRWPS